MKTLLFVFILISTTLAQPFPDLEIFEYTTNRHFIHYDRASASNVEGIELAVKASLDVFEPLWTATQPVIVIDLAPLPFLDDVGHPAVGAIVSRLDPSILTFVLPGTLDDICLIEFYTLPDLIHVTFEVAKAVAHCYQWYNVPALDGLNPTTLNTHSWWYEGGAVWMASLLDDSIALNIWEKIQTDFIERREQTLVKGGQDTYYFWHYAADVLGEEIVMSLMIFMPADVNDHAAYVAEKLGDAETFMHDFAFKMANADIPHAPDPDDLFERYQIDDMPFYAVFSSEPLGVGFTQLNINLDLDADEAIELTLLTDEASGLKMNLDGEFPLVKNDPIRICDPLAKPRIIFSRHVEGTDIDPPAEAQMEVIRLDCDDDSSAEPETLDVASCIVGTWELIQQPRLAGEDFVFTGIQRVTVDPDGTTFTEYDQFTMVTSIQDVGAVTMEFNGAATGKVAVDDTGLVVDAGDTLIDVTATITVAGTTMNMPMGDIAQAGVEMGIQPGTQIECNSAFLHLNVIVEGMEGPFIFQRVMEE